MDTSTWGGVLGMQTRHTYLLSVLSLKERRRIQRILDQTLIGDVERDPIPFLNETDDRKTDALAQSEFVEDVRIERRQNGDTEVPIEDGVVNDVSDLKLDRIRVCLLNFSPSSPRRRPISCPIARTRCFASASPA